jgi:hypothetical protein
MDRLRGVGRHRPVEDFVALRDSMRDSAAADAIVLRQRRAWASSTFVIALVVFLPALARGLVQRQLVAVVIFGALAALTIWLWVLVIRRCGHLDVAADAMTFGNGRGTRVALNRQQGDLLQVGGSASAQWGNTRYPDDPGNRDAHPARPVQGQRSAPGLHRKEDGISSKTVAVHYELAGCASPVGTTSTR